MKLDAWLKQDHPLEDRLLVIERLCQAVNEIHDRGDVVGGLEPSRVALGAEGQCDLSGARKRSPRPPYAPPEGDQSSPNVADIYAAGAISWEVLAGRSPGGSPAHLVEVRPDLQRELADAVMACLEESPDWRPNDLTYLAQMAAARQRAAARGPARASRAPLPPRSATKPVRRRGPSRRTWPLLAALVVVLGLAALAGRQYLGDVVSLFQPEAAGPASEPERAASAPATPATPEPTPPARQRKPTKPAATAPGAETGPAPAAVEAPPDDAPPEASSPAPGEEAPEPDAPPPPPQVAVAAPPPTATAVPSPVTASSAPDAVEPVPPPAAEAQPAPPSAPLPPAVLNAIAPPTVKRPGKVLVDLRGTGLGAHHRAKILPVKKVPWGIRVVRQKHVNDTLITILLELEESAEPGEYAIAVEDGQGGRSEPLVFEVTK